MRASVRKYGERAQRRKQGRTLVADRVLERLDSVRDTSHLLKGQHLCGLSDDLNEEPALGDVERDLRGQPPEETVARQELARGGREGRGADEELATQRAEGEYEGARETTERQAHLEDELAQRRVVPARLEDRGEDLEDLATAVDLPVLHRSGRAQWSVWR